MSGTPSGDLPDSELPRNAPLANAIRMKAQLEAEYRARNN